ncbi:Acetyltransferase (GNAT) family protein [compost metagenome]
MTYSLKKWDDKDFLRIRDFLAQTLKDNPKTQNWLIDRWNFCRYFAHIMHESFELWPETVGIWENDHHEIVAVVNSEGEIQSHESGVAFFQLASRFDDDFMNELIDFAEEKIAITAEGITSLSFVLDQNEQMERLMKSRGYELRDWKDATSCMPVTSQLPVNIPDGFRLADGHELKERAQGMAHGRAFGYCTEEQPGEMMPERCYKAMRQAPDYRPELDMALLDQDGEIASFTTLWYDSLNQLAVLEPVGTLPKYTRMGLGRAVIYSGINRAINMGAEKIYVGTDRPFYRAIGFKPVYVKDVWLKRWPI